jgi:hypothetical protein
MFRMIMYHISLPYYIGQSHVRLAGTWQLARSVLVKLRNSFFFWGWKVAELK